MSKVTLTLSKQELETMDFDTFSKIVNEATEDFASNEQIAPEDVVVKSSLYTDRNELEIILMSPDDVVQDLKHEIFGSNSDV